MKTSDIAVFCGQGFSANTYLFEQEDDTLAVVDPGTDFEGLLRVIGTRKVGKVLLTHAHFDHTFCAPLLREKFGAKICVHPLDAPLLSDPNKNASAFFAVPPLSFAADETFSEGDVLSGRGGSFLVMHTPGHSPGSVCFVGENCILCGDTVFSEGVGRTDLFGGDNGQHLCSLSRLQTLPGEYTCFAGHGPSFVLSRRFAQKSC